MPFTPTNFIVAHSATAPGPDFPDPCFGDLARISYKGKQYVFLWLGTSHGAGGNTYVMQAYGDGGVGTWVQKDSANATITEDTGQLGVGLAPTPVLVGNTVYIVFSKLLAGPTRKLAIKLFNLDTETWGNEYDSVIVLPATPQGLTGFGVVGADYNAVSKTIDLVSNMLATPGGFTRPSFARFDTVGLAWISIAWQQIGDPNGVTSHECAVGLRCDCAGNRHILMLTTDPGGFFIPWHVQHQIVYLNLSTSVVFDTSARVAADNLHLVSRFSIVPAELRFVFITGSIVAVGGSGTTLNYAWATVPLGLNTPVWNTEQVVAYDPNFTSMSSAQVYNINGNPTIFFSTDVNGGPNNQITTIRCAVKSGGLWTIDATLPSPINLVFNIGDPAVGPDFFSIVTFNFTSSTVTDSNGYFSAYGQRLFAQVEDYGVKGRCSASLTLTLKSSFLNPSSSGSGGSGGPVTNPVVCVAQL